VPISVAELDAARDAQGNGARSVLREVQEAAASQAPSRSDRETQEECRRRLIRSSNPVWEALSAKLPKAAITAAYLYVLDATSARFDSPAKISGGRESQLAWESELPLLKEFGFTNKASRMALFFAMERDGHVTTVVLTRWGGSVAVADKRLPEKSPRTNATSTPATLSPEALAWMERANKANGKKK
jgi:hypothetical protein